MKKIRIANVSLAAGRAFRGLADLDFITYEENLPEENARRLFEDQIDLALLPVNAFGASGSYVGLDYGFAVEKSYPLIHLFSNQPVETLDTIYVFEGASASTFLLQLVLRYRYRTQPRIVSKRRLFPAETLKPNEGVLMRPEYTALGSRSFLYEIDLVKEWYDLTGLPFVFLIWATRPLALSFSEHRYFYDRCYRVIKEHLTLHKEGGENARYYLDQRAKAGIERAFHDASSERILPEALYHTGTYNMFDKQPSSLCSEKSVSEIFRGLMDGKRLGMGDAITLAREAKLSDLSMVAEFGPRPRRKSSTLKIYTVVQESHGEEQVFERIERACEAGISDIRYIPTPDSLSSLSYYKELFHSISSNYPVALQAFSPRSLLLLSKQESLSIQEVCAAIIKSGVIEISAAGTGMLLDHIKTERPQRGPFLSADYMRVLKWAHRYGGITSARLTMSTSESWEERIIHLLKLRNIQDMNPGFRNFNLRTEAHSTLTMEERVRGYLISRLFLDNVPQAKEVISSLHEFGKLFRLNFGVDEICYYDFGDHPKSTKARLESHFQKLFPERVASEERSSAAHPLPFIS